MSSASVPTAKPAAKAGTRTSAPGNRAGCNRTRQGGFTLLELIVVVALIALSTAVISLALRDPAATRLEHEAERLAALLESGRAEARASGVAARWEPTATGFRFVGLPDRLGLPTRWLGDGVSAEIVGARAVVLGPEPLIGAQRIVLRLEGHVATITTDGLSPFAIETASAGNVAMSQ